MIERRSFLRGLAGVALVTLSPEILERYWWALGGYQEPWHLWGDGVHDDSRALQWRLDNGYGMVEGRVQIPIGRYLTESTLRIRQPALLRGLQLESSALPVLELHEAAAGSEVSFCQLTRKWDGVKPSGCFIEWRG